MIERQIIMNFAAPPTADDLDVIAQDVLETLPDALVMLCEDVEILVEEFPDEATEQELELEDPYELLALFRKGNEISPGVVRKQPSGDDLLILYRRPILDMWCESCEDLSMLVRQLMVEELARSFDFPDTDIEELARPL